MENGNVDFNIQNYDITDLEYFFKLDDIPNYTIQDVDIKANEIQNNVLNGSTFNPSVKNGFVKFIEHGKSKLLHNKLGEHQSGEHQSGEHHPSVYNETILPTNRFSQTNGHIIDETSAPNFISTDPSQFYKGDLNPLNTRVLTRILNIDTKFRDDLNSISSDFIINLPIKFSQIASMEVSAIELPIGFYGISAAIGNNYFELVVDGAGPVVITIPDGNYLNTELIDALNTTISTLGAPYDTVTFTLNPINYKVTVTTTSVSVELYFNTDQTGQCKVDPNTQLSSRLGYNLGFTKESYTGEITYTGESLIESRAIKYLFLSVDDYQQNVNSNAFISAFQKSYLDNNILARISTKMVFENTIINDNELLSKPREYFGPVDIQRLRIRLTDEYGRILDMNGMNYSFCLTMKQIYKF
jgi:hypothetical protein